VLSGALAPSLALAPLQFSTPQSVFHHLRQVTYWTLSQHLYTIQKFMFAIDWNTQKSEIFLDKKKGLSFGYLIGFTPQ